MPFNPEKTTRKEISENNFSDKDNKRPFNVIAHQEKFKQETEQQENQAKKQKIKIEQQEMEKPFSISTTDGTLKVTASNLLSPHELTQAISLMSETDKMKLQQAAKAELIKRAEALSSDPKELTIHLQNQDMVQNLSDTMSNLSIEDNNDESSTALKLEKAMENKGKQLQTLVDEIGKINESIAPKHVEEISNMCEKAIKIIEEQENITAQIDTITELYEPQYTGVDASTKAMLELEEDQLRINTIEEYRLRQDAAYNELKKAYIKFGGDESKLEEPSDHFSNGKDHIMNYLDFNENTSQISDTGEPTSEDLKDRDIPYAYQWLQYELAKASKLPNRDNSLQNIITEAYNLVTEHKKVLEALETEEGKLYPSHEKNQNACTARFNKEVDLLALKFGFEKDHVDYLTNPANPQEQLDHWDGQFKEQYDQLFKNFNDKTIELGDVYEKNVLLPLYQPYYTKLMHCIKELQKSNPEYQPHFDIKKKLELFFSDNNTAREFAVEKSLATGYLTCWQENTPSGTEFVNAVQQIIGLKIVDLNDDKEITPEKLEILKDACNTFKEVAKQNPGQFLSPLKQVLVKARDLNEWADNFQNKWFDLGEDWVQKGMGHLGIQADNFTDSHMALLINGSEKSEDILNLAGSQQPHPIDEIAADYQANNPDQIVSTYEGFMRAKAPLEYIHSLLRDGVPVSGIPKTIGGGEVRDVSGMDFSCLPRATLLAAHPEWPPAFRENLVTKVKEYVVQNLQARVDSYKNTVSQLKVDIANQLMADADVIKKDFEKRVKEKIEKGDIKPASGPHYTDSIIDNVIAKMAQEKASVQLAMPDIEDINVNVNDMLNAGGNSGQILFEYMRNTKVQDPITKQGVLLLDPDRTFLTYQYLSDKKRIQCIETSSGTSQDPPYAILREDRGAEHFQAVLPPGIKLSDIHSENSRDTHEASSNEEGHNTQFIPDIFLGGSNW